MAKQKKFQDPYNYLYLDNEEPSAVDIVFENIDKQKEKDTVSSTLPPRPVEEEVPPLHFTGKIEEELYYEKMMADNARQDLQNLSSGNEELRRETREKIKNMMGIWRLRYVNNIKYYPLSREEKHIIRMDYYGTIDEPVRIPTRSKSSKTYLNFINSPYKQKLENPQYKLETSPAWNKFRQFPRFRKIEGNLLKQLAQMDIPPEMLPQMNAYDFADVLYRAFKDTANEYGKVRIFTGARRSFIKDFIRKNERPFRAYLKNINVDDRYADALIEQMHKKGATNDIDVYDSAKALNLLQKYQQKGLIPKDEQLSLNLTSAQLELIKMQGDYPSVAVLDKEGKTLKGPTFTVHHKIAVKDAGEATYLADVNHFENLCLTIEDPYHRLLHSLDRTEISNFRESYKARIYMKDPHLVFWGGFSPVFHIYYDYNQDPRSHRLMENNYKWIKEHLSQITPLPDFDPELINAAAYAGKVSRKQKKMQKKKEENNNILQKNKNTSAALHRKKETDKKTNNDDTENKSPSSSKASNITISKRIQKLKKDYLLQKQQEKKYKNKQTRGGANTRKAQKIKNIIDSLFFAKLRELDKR